MIPYDPQVYGTVVQSRTFSVVAPTIKNNLPLKIRGMLLDPISSNESKDMSSLTDLPGVVYPCMHFILNRHRCAMFILCIGFI